MRIKRMGILDFLIAAALVAGTVFLLPLLKSSSPDSVVVYRDNSLVAEYPLNTNLIFTINGNNGPVEVQIKDKSVSIEHVNCPHQICKQSGAINHTYEQLICAPNHILLEIRSSRSSSSADGITY